MGFKAEWNKTAKEVHQTAVDKGWWERFVRVKGCEENEDGMHRLEPHVYSEGDYMGMGLQCVDCKKIMDPDMASELMFKKATERNVGELIALFHSELSEALEGMRHGNPPNDQLPEYSYIEVELADLLIRVMDAASAMGWRVGEALEAKMEYNRERAHRHGKAF